MVLVSKAVNYDLLPDIFPEPALRTLNNSETDIEEYGVVATLLLSNIVGYTAMARDMSPIDLTKMLNDLYGLADVYIGYTKSQPLETSK